MKTNDRKVLHSSEGRLSCNYKAQYVQVKQMVISYLKHHDAIKSLDHVHRMGRAVVGFNMNNGEDISCITIPNANKCSSLL